MSHLHIPDGLLPVWLWVAGLVAASVVVGFSLFMLRNVDLRKKIPLLGMMSAMMLVGMSIEVVPYHLNLSVITGIILGPWLAMVAALIVNLFLALVGHGGVTVVGLNTLVIGFEGVMGYILFSVFRKALKPALSAAVRNLPYPFYVYVPNAAHCFSRERRPEHCLDRGTQGGYGEHTRRVRKTHSLFGRRFQF